MKDVSGTNGKAREVGMTTDMKNVVKNCLMNNNKL